MADQLDQIVQRMIDAGENEDNIATVIQHFKRQSVSSPSAADMIGMMGKAPQPVEETPSSPSFMNRLRSIAEPMTEPWNQPTTMGKIGGLIGGLLPTVIGEATPFVTSAVKQGYAGSSKLRQLPGNALRIMVDKATDPRSLQTVAQDNFNNLPLYQQMERLPTETGIATGPSRAGMPRLSAPPVAATPKPALSSLDVLRIKQLIEQGIPQDQAVETVLSLRSQGLTGR